ncbi:hypothetical protein [Massilia sp.]|uniref:hypothetical protein n=1 Tax=Massilia sp. TaxID=1882437 RepID=UPI00352CA7F1
MAALTEESRETLAGVEQRCREQAANLQNQVDAATVALSRTSTIAQQAANDMDSAARRMEWRYYLLAVSTGLMSGLLVSAFWLLLAPSVMDAAPSAKVPPVLLSPKTPPARQSNAR